MQAAFDNMQSNKYHVGRGYGTVAAFVYPTIRPYMMHQYEAALLPRQALQ
jgi:hypothetical protein